MSVPGTVYLLHFDTPYHHARHYVGWASQLKKRLAHHANGTGARLTAAVAKAGIGWTVAKTWKNRDRHFERTIKNGKNTPRLCPLCQSRARPAGGV